MDVLKIAVAHVIRLKTVKNHFDKGDKLRRFGTFDDSCGQLLLTRPSVMEVSP